MADHVLEVHVLTVIVLIRQVVIPAFNLLDHTFSVHCGDISGELVDLWFVIW